MIEKRRHIRFPSRLLMTTFLNEDEDSIVNSNGIYSEDISVEGLRIIYPQQLSRGAMLKLKLFLFSDPVPVFLEGTIVWSQKTKRYRDDLGESANREEDCYCRAGMRLFDIHSLDQERVLRWINKELAMDKV